MKKSILLALFLIISTLVSSCAGDAIETERRGDYEVELLFNKNGCNIYRFKDAGYYIYWSDCRGEIKSTYYDGASKTNKQVQTIND